MKMNSLSIRSHEVSTSLFSKKLGGSFPVPQVEFSQRFFKYWCEQTRYGPSPQTGICHYFSPCIWIKFMLLGYRWTCFILVVPDAINERLSKGSDNILDTTSWEVSFHVSIPFPKYCTLYLDCVRFLKINEFSSCASRYMEEIIENTLSLLALHSEQGMSSPGSEKSLEPIHLISLLDIKATWFKKWMVSQVFIKE